MAEVPIIRICSLGLSALLAAGLAGSPALASRGDSAAALNRFVEARLAESSDQSQVAAAIYAQSLKEQPDNALLAGKAYVSAIETGDVELAVKAVRVLQLRGQAEPEMPLLLFASAFAQRDWNGAELAAVELEALKNFAFLEPFLAAWLETARGGDGIAILSRARSDATARYYLEEHLILNSLAHRREKEALALLGAVVERNEPRMAPVRMIAARHLWARNEPEAAKDILKTRSTAPEQRLYQQIETGQKKGVAQKVSASTGLAFLFQRLSSDLASQQADFLSQLLALASAHVAGNSDYARLMLGRSYARAEKHDRAVAEFSRIGSESPYFLVGLSSGIASLVADGNYKQAIARLDSVMDRDPDSPELHILKGQTLQAQGDHAAAAGAFASAVRLGERLNRSDLVMANYWLALGGAQEQAGIWPEGLESLRRANELQPNSPTILNYLGYAQLERRVNKAEAVAAIKQAHELRSTSPAITDSLGWAYFITGDHERAVTYLETALEGQPQDPTINEHLGDAYWTVGRIYEARYAWKSAKLFAEDEDAQRLASKIDLGLRPDLVSP
ncbi:tetratricopeptide repeat protein [Sphingorhabdus sp. SMR4y]|uniref:tetratricopeptide repeat protein n=1 Tax=Sphingorhabdus sp. SMR4y TaxID=2584094 RepID=UPI000B5C9B36|nr:tetratricopeptide repeat protein [Sphingorhabdus sp. SMR4y]ASK87623.1 bacteriophage N4 receptor, outer membrane subunit [Sphingorhabdus sp. SMR4y]